MSFYQFEATGDSTGFSWSPCDRCGSKLGGERYKWNYVDEEGAEGAGEICTDCLYVANGIHTGENL